MKAKHRKTLQEVFARPTRANITFSDIESLIQSVGGEVREGDGSRVALELGGGARLYLHRPHPGKEAKKYQVEKIRAWLEARGVKP